MCTAPGNFSFLSLNSCPINNFHPRPGCLHRPFVSAAAPPRDLQGIFCLLSNLSYFQLSFKVWSRLDKRQTSSNRRDWRAMRSVDGPDIFYTSILNTRRYVTVKHTIRSLNIWIRSSSPNTTTNLVRPVCKLKKRGAIWNRCLLLVNPAACMSRKWN